MPTLRDPIDGGQIVLEKEKRPEKGKYDIRSKEFPRGPRSFPEARWILDGYLMRARQQ
jgi:hypothetical protein